MGAFHPAGGRAIRTLRIFRTNPPGMRALKTLLIILFALLGLMVILGLMGPSTTVVTRSAVIQAPAEVIFPYVSNLRTMHEWSPWKDMDRDQKTTWEGEDGTVGSIQKWEGDTVGKGSQRITALDPNRSVRSELKFMEPWEATSEVGIDLEPADGGTKVSWTMTQQNGFMAKVMSVFMDMDKMVGPDFEKGLAKLKVMAEAEESRLEEIRSRTFLGYEISTVDRPEMKYVGKRSTIKFDQMDRFFESTYNLSAAQLAAGQVEIVGAPSALYYDWNESTRTTDMMPAFPVNPGQELKLRGLDVVTVPGGNMLHTAHRGSPDGSAEAHKAMDAYLSAKGLQQYGQVIEEYITGPPQEPDTAKWVTHIYYMAK